MVVIDQNLPAAAILAKAAHDPFAALCDGDAAFGAPECVGAGINRVCQDVSSSALTAHSDAARDRPIFQSAMTQPCVGWTRDRFGLYRGIDHDPLEITGRQRSGLVRHRQVFLD